MARKIDPAFPAFVGNAEAARWDLEMHQREQAKRSNRSRSIPKRCFDDAAARVASRLDGPDWEGATAVDFVAAHAELHRRVYGSEPAALPARERTQAAYAAGKMLREKFGGDPLAMAEFFAWVWARERAKLKMRLPNFRINWRAQFGGYLWDDWRLASLHARRPA